RMLRRSAYRRWPARDFTWRFDPPGFIWEKGMLPCKLSARRMPRIAGALLAATSLATAADDTASKPSPTAASDTAQTQSPNDEIGRLKAQLAAQQKQLETLQHMMEQQQQLLEKTISAPAAQPAVRPNLGSVASLTPVVPAPSP